MLVSELEFLKTIWSIQTRSQMGCYSHQILNFKIIPESKKKFQMVDRTKFQFWNGTAKEMQKTKSRWKNVHFYSSCHNRTKFNFNIEWWYFSRWQLSRLPRNFFDYYIYGSREQPCIRPFSISIWVKIPHLGRYRFIP